MPNHAHGHSSQKHSAASVKDPVCGMDVNPESTEHFCKNGDDAYFFCSARCKTKFEAEPGRYRKSRQPEKVIKVPEGKIYTCPMHPQIRLYGVSAYGTELGW